MGLSYQLHRITGNAGDPDPMLRMFGTPRIGVFGGNFGSSRGDNTHNGKKIIFLPAAFAVMLITATSKSEASEALSE